MSDLAGIVQLRNLKRVFRNPGYYTVASEKAASSSRHVQDHISERELEEVAQLLVGREWTLNKAVATVSRAGISLRYDYGHKLSYYVQDIMTVLVALGRGTVDTGSREFVWRFREVA